MPRFIHALRFHAINRGGRKSHHFRQGGSKNPPDASCAATCLDAQEGYSIPPDLQRTDSNRFLISRYAFSQSAASASGCEHFTPCVQASCVFTSGSDNVTPCRHCPHQGVNSSLPVANRGGDSSLPVVRNGLFYFCHTPILKCQLLTPDVSAHIRATIVIPCRKWGGNECHPCQGVRK